MGLEIFKLLVRPVPRENMKMFLFPTFVVESIIKEMFTILRVEVNQLSYLLAGKGSTVLLMGNEAIARGALEAGICFAAAYPGTPSTEILEALSSVAKDCGIYVEWSVNEKVAFEASYAAAITGVRSLVAMKHVGLNVAADILMSSGYAGVKEGFVIVSADDPSEHSSQNEQDNRWFGFLAHVPVIEPSSAREAYYFTKQAYELSSRIQQPVILRTTTRISHTRMPVKLADEIPKEKKCTGEFDRDVSRWVLVPANARRLKKERVVKIWKEIRENTSSPFVTVLNQGRKKVIIASGISYSHVSEALQLMGKQSDFTVVKVNMPVPLPVKPIAEAIRDAEEILVVEELDPVVEQQVRSIASSLGISAKIMGKDVIPESDELSIEEIYRAIKVFLGEDPVTPWTPGKPLATTPPIPPRPPVMCAGCPHRSTYYIVKVAANKAGVRRPVFTGDIGCYTLGFSKPFETQMTCFEMGGSLGIAHGLAIVQKDPVIAVIGDSTFFHAGIPPAINSVYNKSRVIPLILDNMTTAMTGHQPHPGTGVTAIGEESSKILPEDVLKAVGYDVYVIDPLDVKKSIETVAEVFRKYQEGRRVAVVSRMRCALEALRDARKKKIVLPVYIVVDEKCTGCGACVNLTACPAIVLPVGKKKPVILPELCAGCGLCASICPFNAIEVSNKPSENWREAWR